MISKKRLRTEYVLVDWLTTAVGFFVFNIYRYYHFHVVEVSAMPLTQYLTQPKLLAEEVFFPAIMLAVYWLSGYYHDPFQRSRLQELSQTVFSAFFNTMFIYLALLTNDQIDVSSHNYAMLAMLFSTLFICTYAGRIIVTTKRFRMLRKKRWKFSTLILGTPDKALEVTRQLQSSLANLGYSPDAYILTGDRVPEEFDGKPVFRLENVQEVCHDLGISQIIVALPKISDDELLEMLRQLFMLDIPVKISPNLQDYLTSGIMLQDIYGEPFVDITKPCMKPSTRSIKRSMDVVFSSIALILIAVPALFIALRIRMDSKGPLLYRQTRIGLHRKPFTIYKFRTMYTDAEAAGPQLSSDNDPRITSSGRFLRKYRLDELPQFWNVLRGDMSLVGPRPERDYYIQRILEKAPYYTLLHQVRPGITSWGMVKYGYASDIEQMIERVRYDLLYLSNMSISIDFKILIYTVRTVLLGKGK